MDNADLFPMVRLHTINSEIVENSNLVSPINADFVENESAGVGGNKNVHGNKRQLNKKQNSNNQ